MMTQDQLNRMENVRQRLQDRRLTAVSQETGINYAVLWAFRSGRRPVITMDQLLSLEAYFEVKR